MSNSDVAPSAMRRERPVVVVPNASRKLDLGTAVVPPWEPVVSDDYTDPKDLPLKEWVGQALGAASMCWIPRPSTQEFNSREASRLVDALLGRIELALEQAFDRGLKAGVEEASK